MRKKQIKKTFLLLSVFLFLQTLVYAHGKSNSFYQWSYRATSIVQTLFKFPSPYQGPNSFLSRNETETVTNYIVSGRIHFLSSLTGGLDIQMTRGVGVGGGGVGLAGYVNGDVVFAGAFARTPFPARYFLQWTQPVTPDSHLVVRFGKFAVTDVFDQNLYANETNTQFLNWTFINDTAYDYAADTIGYSGGLAVSWIHPGWALRLGIFQMPTVANGINLSTDMAHNQGDQMELDFYPRITSKLHRMTVRFLLYRNLADMGNYAESLALAQETNTIPCISCTARVGAVKYGFGINLDQPLSKDKRTGIFMRYGWNNGQTQSFVFTEADRTFSLGAQLSGKLWKIPNDYAGIALGQNDLSSVHAAYLAAGGIGTWLGDGKLNYGSERIFEVYYAHRIFSHETITLDYQKIANPGYNRDRGPVNVISLRFRITG